MTNQTPSRRSARGDVSWRSFTALLTACAVLWSPAGHAWDDRGHALIAGAAFDGLDPPVARALVARLERHPRFQQDFAGLMPANLSATDRDRWLVTHASTWPDIARRFDHAPAGARDELVDRFHRGWWHYVNFPVYLDSDDAGWAPEPRAENAVRALADIRDELDAGRVDPGQIAVSLCWLLHLVGDVHQPLHGAALFDRRQFPRGDRGGNDIELDTGQNLHAFWDGAVDADVVLDLTVDADLSFAPRRWAMESRAEAERSVYGEVLRRQLLEQLLAQGPATVDLAYRAAARAVAVERMRLAAARLAHLLEELIDEALDEVR